MTNSGITDRDIDQAFSDHKITCGGVREDYFALLYLMREFGLPVEVAKRQIAFHGHDYGIDAYHLDDRTLYLLQTKWSSSHKLFRESLERLIKDGMEQIFGNVGQDRRQNELLFEVKRTITAARSKIDTVNIQFIFNGDPEEAERSPVLEQLGEQLYSKRYLINEFFGRETAMQIQYLRPRIHAPLPPPPISHKVLMHQPLQQSGPNGEVMHLGFVRLLDLDAMFQSLGQRFFSRNIRSFVGEGTAPNRAILQSLRRIVHEGKENPGVFAFNHNGVTIAAQRFAHNDGGYELTEPRLLNGAQTVTTFCRFLAEARTKFGDVDNNAKVAELHVPCKIITQGSEAFITTVTINNNRQNPIEPWNLRANDLIQLKLQEKFRDELKMYYERQENAFANLTDQELEQQPPCLRGRSTPAGRRGARPQPDQPTGPTVRAAPEPAGPRRRGGSPKCCGCRRRGEQEPGVSRGLFLGRTCQHRVIDGQPRLAPHQHLRERGEHGRHVHRRPARLQ